jgi:hypothetical protein
VQPEGRRGREFRGEIRERSDRVPKISAEPVAEPLARSPEVATRERSDRAAEGFTAKKRPRQGPDSAAQRHPGERHATWSDSDCVRHLLWDLSH